ncbi:MAG: SLBB domain-containing protein [Burkholderiales bacterium]|nr:SLBB domain-containing protein [Burkholderiales bacterium]
MRYSPLLAILIGLFIVSKPVLAQEVSGSVGGVLATPVSPAVSLSSNPSSRVGATTQQSVQSMALSNMAPAAIANAPMAAIGDVKAGDQAMAVVAVNDQQEKNEFQDFVRLSAGRDLPLFGYNLFGASPSTFAPVDRIPVTADYVLGPGDEVVVRAWGQIDIDYRATVDRNGDFYIPKVGNVNVAGIKYQELQAYLKTAIGRVFRNFDLSVNLGQLRSIQVFVVGQARRPGSYTVSSMSTLVNTLFASGGPSTKGSMRRIQLKRDNKVITEFDMYDLLVKGDKSKDARLLPGDVIYIPAAGPLVAITGSVNAAAIYEIKGKPSLKEAIALAGGLTTTAAAEKVTLERIVKRKTRVVEEFKFDHAGLARTLEDGDLITVLSISPRFDNAVTLRGNVAATARYPWQNGMRLKDLIPERDALITPDYWVRKNAATRVEIDAESKLRNDVKHTIAEVNWDYAVIERLNAADLTTSLIPFSLTKLLINNDPDANLLLLAGDVVTIFSKDDIKVPIARQTKYVRLEGEINQAGLYKAEPGETLRQLAARIGSVTPEAYLFGAEFTRESARVQQQKKMDEALNRMESESERNAANRAQNVLSQEDAQSLKAEAEGRKALIARLRQIKATGRIPLELTPESTVQNLPDIVLEDGDHFFVPSRPSVVGVIGAVYTENTFLYKSDKQVSDYLAQAGGMTKDADEKHAYILKADGSILSSQQSGWFSGFGGRRLMPGDTIVIPEQTDKTTWVKELKDWTQILYQFGLGAAAIKVLK